MLALIASPIARYLAGAAFVVGLLGYTYHLGRSHGSASVRAEIAADNSKRLQEANRARDDAMRCAIDPECLRKPDAFLRKD
jgi:hypothetical protein